MKKLTFAALLMAMVLGVSFGANAQKLPLDDRGYPIPVLRFNIGTERFGVVTLTVTYDATSRGGTSPDHLFGGTVSGRGRLGTMVIRIACDTDAHVRIETSIDALATATTRDAVVFAGVPAFVRIVASNDRFAVVQKNASGSCWFTPLE